MLNEKLQIIHETDTHIICLVNPGALLVFNKLALKDKGRKDIGESHGVIYSDSCNIVRDSSFHEKLVVALSLPKVTNIPPIPKCKPLKVDHSIDILE